MRTLLTLLALSTFIHAAPEAFEVGSDKIDQLPRGKEADGIIGDFVLRNDKIEAVISGNLPLRRANMSTFYGDDGITPGCLYDLTLRGANNDQIVIFGPTAQQGRVSWVRVGKNGKDGEASVECVVTGALNGGLAKRHEYKLRDGWQGVLVTTTVTNEGADAQKIALADKWTNFKRMGSAFSIAWAEAIDPADRAGYAYGVTEAPAGFAPTKPTDLKPGESLTFSRFLAVGHSPLEAVGLVAERRGVVGQVSGVLKDKAGKPVSGGQLLISAAASTAGVAQTDKDGRFAFALPEGKYSAEITDQGRATVTREFEVKAGAATKLDATLAAASAIQFDIRDEAKRSIPCKAQFLAEEGTELVNLGPEMRARGCKDQYHSERGEFRVQLPPGKYRVVVTRGIEHSHLSRTIELKPGETASFSGTLKRLVDTAGWVSADYHNHSTPSGDNVCGTDDRIINLAAEHIEFAPTTEHNRLYDWSPHIERLKLSDYVQTVPGMELTGSAAHFNAFPFKPEPGKQDSGAPVWNKDPRITAITLRDWQGAEPDRWIQINHPDMTKNFSDADDDGRADGGFTGLAMLIDGVETQNYSDSNILHPAPYRIGRGRDGKENASEVREFVWLQMLNRGHRYVGVAVCDAHTVWGNGVGGWRMYMPSASDEPAKIDWRENSRHAKAGRSILTSGPYLTVATSDGTLPGGTTRAQSGGVKLRVKVQCTDWIDIDRVQVLVNGRQPADLSFTRATHPKMFADGVVKFEREIFVPLAQDAHIIVVARGEKSTLATGFGTSGQANVRPTAYNNPIFVDADGGGFTPNGDTLGWPLPVKKPNLDEIKRQLAANGLPAVPPPVKTIAP
ncbi:MAG: CehA/McbA family metallohydrolase [Chthoniobacteraceae bacterium]